MSAADYLPRRFSLPSLRSAADACEGCALFEGATQTVFGEGFASARVVMIGEQPGDEEDRSGRPFVGPAGRLLEQMMLAAGLAREDVYLTNAVKHFKWEPRGKLRIHQKPSSSEALACRPWLEAELAVIRPDTLVLLGATAAQTLLGRAFSVSQARGVPFRSNHARWTLATVHPSSLLRIPDEVERRAARARFIHELELVARRLRGHAADAHAR